VGNNLSFPVIWGDGAGLSLPGEFLQASLTVPWTGTNPCLGGLVPYAQKTEDNLWQAENSAAGPYLEEGHLYVDQIDWGDSLESVDMKVGRPVRVELSLYKALVDPMTGYEMVMLANPTIRPAIEIAEEGDAGGDAVDATNNLTYIDVDVLAGGG